MKCPARLRTWRTGAWAIRRQPQFPPPRLLRGITQAACPPLLHRLLPPACFTIPTGSRASPLGSDLVNNAKVARKPKKQADSHKVSQSIPYWGHVHGKGSWAAVRRGSLHPEAEAGVYVLRETKLTLLADKDLAFLKSYEHVKHQLNSPGPRLAQRPGQLFPRPGSSWWATGWL